MKSIRKPVANVIIFIVVCAGILLAIGMCALQMAMYFGGSGQLSGAVDAGALTVGKHAATTEVMLAQGDEEQFMEFADRNSEGVTTTELNQVLAKALLIQMNEAEMERNGSASQESKAHADSIIKAAHDITEKMTKKVTNFKNWQDKFEQAANSNTLAFLGTSAKTQMDAGSGWGTSYVDRGEESNIYFDPQQLPEGFSADTFGVKKGDKYFFKGYEPLKAGDKTLYLVPFKPDGQPHLISGKTFEANTLEKKPFQDWPKPFPNAISCQGKSVNDSKQVFQAKSFTQINPNKTNPLYINGLVRINFDQNVAHWYVNGSPASTPSIGEMIGKALSGLSQLGSQTSQAISNMSGLMSQISQKIAEAKAAQGNAQGAAGTGDASGNPAVDSNSPTGIGGGGVASISGPILGKAGIDKELKDAAQLIKDDGAAISNASHLLTDNGTGVISNDGSGIISNGGSGIISQDGAGISRGAGIIGDYGSGLISDRGHGIVTDNGAGIVTDNGAGLAQIANVISNDGAGLTGGRRSLMSVGEGDAQRANLAAKTLQQLQPQLATAFNSLMNAVKKPDTAPHGSESFYGFAPEQQNRTFPLATGSLFVQAFLGNEYKPPANLYTAICALNGDYKQMKKVIGQRLRELNADYKDDDFQKILESCPMNPTNRFYVIYYDKEEKKFKAEGRREDSLKPADGFEKEIGRDSQQEKPNWVIATPTGPGAKPLPSKCTSRGTFLWKPGTGYNGTLGELHVKREVDIYANGMVGLN